MSTLFKDIYSQNEVIRNDNRLQNKSTNQIYQLYYTYLKTGISYFFRDCYKDLTPIPFSQTEYYFKAIANDNAYLLTTPNIPSVNCNFYVGYAVDENSVYTEIATDKYTYDSSTNVLTIDTSVLIPVGYSVYISAYQVGQFNCDLNFDEMNILNEGMIIPFLEEQQNRNSLLTQMVWGGSTKISSQASHIDSVSNIVENQISKVKRMIKEYSYSANPDKLRGLGGNVQ